MAKHNTIGKRGEQLAEEWLLNNGYTLLHKNWRHIHLEVDFIVCKNDTLYFFEVKTRTTTTFGNPEESVTTKKMKNLKEASAEYQYQYPQWKWIQFNVLAILIKNKQITYWLNEDVYL